jgi:hypothetical protein
MIYFAAEKFCLFFVKSRSCSRLLLSKATAHEAAKSCSCSYHSGKHDGDDDEDAEEDEV